MNKNLLFVMGLSLSCASAFAADAPTPASPLARPAAPRQISFDELKARCLHPEQFDVQRAPQNIRVQCAEQHREYIAAPAGEFALPNERKVFAAVLADKFAVNVEEKSIPMAAAQGSCLRFKEVQQTMTLEKALTCDEVLNIKTDTQDYCIPVLDAAKVANPKLMVVLDTGKFMDTCATPVVPAPTPPHALD
jgi:hypothetical protein